MSPTAWKNRLRFGRVLLGAAVWVLVPSALTWGAPPPPTLGGSVSEKSYVWQYALLGLCIALGLLLLCRPKARKQEVERIVSD